MKNRQLPFIIAILIVSVLLGYLIIRQDQPSKTHSHEAGYTHDTEHHEAAEPAKGPHGGKYFSQGDFAVEVTIFETGIPPQFRVYTYENGKLIRDASTSVDIELSRLGRPVQAFKFKREADYYVGNQVVVEPHSFDVTINVSHKGKPYHWQYSQVEARVEMSDEVLASSGIKLEKAGPAIITTSVKLPGEVAFNADRIVHVVPRVSGLVAVVKVSAGQQVNKGDLLAIVESQRLAEMRSELHAAEKRLGLAKTTLERERKLWEEKITAEQDYLAARQAHVEADIARNLAAEKLSTLGVRGYSRQNTAQYEVRAPIAGLVVDKKIASGQTVQDQQEIFTLADIGTVWVNATVYPKDINAVKIGSLAKVRASASDTEGEGTVEFIGAFMGEQTRTATARLTLDNTHGQWRPGMFVDVILTQDSTEVPVAVKAEALQTIRDWTVVFGRYGRYFEARPIELGRSDGQMVEVLSGLSAGEVYAATNSFAIKADIGKSGATHDH
ncbi:efflux RND transporter periplasmic adaptor subunit [Methylobacillus sp.]|uniref:efflux RND transporter periplasmic adaptor subunit n=1 Tax=Methylobacillus sp. TaxID=56818 RepID=UPI002FDF4DC1